MVSDFYTEDDSQAVRFVLSSASNKRHRKRGACTPKTLDRSCQMPSTSNDGRSNAARASNFLSGAEALFNAIVHPIRITVSILKTPFRFSEQIANSQNALRESIIYNGEGTLVLVIVSNLVSGSLSVHLLP